MVGLSGEGGDVVEYASGCQGLHLWLCGAGWQASFWTIRQIGVFSAHIMRTFMRVEDDAMIGPHARLPVFMDVFADMHVHM